MQRQVGLTPVPKGVEPLQGLNTFIKNAVTALSIDVLGLIAGHRCNNGYVVLGEKLSQVFVAGFEKYGEVAAVDDVARAIGCGELLHEVAKVGDHFRCATSQVDGRNRSGFDPLKDFIDGLALHHFFTPRACTDMAMKTGEITDSADVELEDFDCTAVERNVVLF